MFKSKPKISEQPSEKNEELHPIELLQELTPRQIQTLNNQWINSIEAFLGMADKEESNILLANLLEISPDKLTELIQEAIKVIGAEQAQRLMSGITGGETGALLTEKQKKTFKDNNTKQ